MLVKLFAFVGSNDDSHFLNLFGNEAAMAEHMHHCAGEAWEGEDGDYPDDADAAWDIIARRRGETYDSDAHLVDVALAVPADGVAAARAAVEAIRFARDCLKVAGAPRAAKKARLALSSAEGAVRHAENKALWS
ncbi:Uncharacterized protein MLTONO_p0071 (plasmid) [Mesorhizobium loti]|uniref:hypothetical protein n=1 Tax=Mesorhizobium sp. 131-2-5 TaxID=2744519 RepID=UPI0008199AEB|nr:hypothetical protein [Mesorhizobium sp. 131-2-5]BAV52541.1 Uncharacterized protein MLTONO_p0071 [Mesorhizobium loti]BCH05103.1 hypothetical protein MesoLj131b_71020 [Mesorhizobium sp. 131-2-5]